MLESSIAFQSLFHEKTFVSSISFMIFASHSRRITSLIYFISFFSWVHLYYTQKIGFVKTLCTNNPLYICATYTILGHVKWDSILTSFYNLKAFFCAYITNNTYLYVALWRTKAFFGLYDEKSLWIFFIFFLKKVILCHQEWGLRSAFVHLWQDAQNRALRNEAQLCWFFRRRCRTYHLRKEVHRLMKNALLSDVFCRFRD